MKAFLRYLNIRRRIFLKNTKPQIRRYKHTFLHANMKLLTAIFLAHANTFSSLRSTAAFKTSPSFT